MDPPVCIIYARLQQRTGCCQSARVHPAFVGQCIRERAPARFGEQSMVSAHTERKASGYYLGVQPKTLGPVGNRTAACLRGQSLVGAIVLRWDAPKPQTAKSTTTESKATKPETTESAATKSTPTESKARVRQYVAHSFKSSAWIAILFFVPSVGMQSYDSASSNRPPCYLTLSRNKCNSCLLFQNVLIGALATREANRTRGRKGAGRNRAAGVHNAPLGIRLEVGV